MKYWIVEHPTRSIHKATVWHQDVEPGDLNREFTVVKFFEKTGDAVRWVVDTYRRNHKIGPVLWGPVGCNDLNEMP